MKTLRRAIFALSLCATNAWGQVWVQEITGALTHIESVASDDQRNCFVSGFTVGDANTVVNFGVTNLPVGPFFARYSRSGELIYAQQTEEVRMLTIVGPKLLAVEGTNICEVRDNGRKKVNAVIDSPDVSVDALSSCDEHSFVIAGSFSGNVTIGKAKLVASDSNSISGFAARLNANGKVLWLVELPFSFAIDVAGTRNGGAYVLGAGFEVRAIGNHGEPLWTETVSGNHSGVPTSIAADPSGGCLVAGSFSGTIQAGNQQLQFNAGRSAFTYEFNSSGQPEFAWMLNSFSFDPEVVFDRSGNWYVGMTVGGSGNGLVLKNGGNAPAIQFGSTDDDWLQTLTVGRDKTLYVTGTCNGAPTTVGSTVLTNSGTFIAKFKLP